MGSGLGLEHFPSYCMGKQEREGHDFRGCGKSQEGRKKLTSGAEARTHFQPAPLAASVALSTVMTTKVFISQRPGGVARTLLSAQASQILLLFNRKLGTTSSI